MNQWLTAKRTSNKATHFCKIWWMGSLNEKTKRIEILMSKRTDFDSDKSIGSLMERCNIEQPRVLL